MNYTPYVDFEPGDYVGHHITRVGCMKCNETIGSKDPITNALYFYDHKRDVRVFLNNGSVADVPVCDSCQKSFSEADLDLVERTMKHGWMMEQSWAFRKFPTRGADSVIHAGRVAKDIKILGRATR